MYSLRYSDHCRLISTVPDRAKIEFTIAVFIYEAVHEITAGHRSLSGTISYVTDRIRFPPVTMTDRFLNFNIISYTKDRHELPVTGTKCRLPDTMSGTGEIFISGAGIRQKNQNLEFFSLSKY